jgi:hypothetical protein
MNRLGRHQKGVTIWAILLIAIMLGFGGIFGLKLLPVYVEWYKVEKAIRGALQTGVEQQPKAAIRETVLRRLDIDSVLRFTHRNFDNFFKIEKEGATVRIGVDYEVEEPLFYNISMLVKFSNSYTN